jgi:hypothetical protein
MLEQLVRQFIIHGAKLAPQEISRFCHGLGQTASFVLLATTARTGIVASYFCHRLLLYWGDLCVPGQLTGAALK